MSSLVTERTDTEPPYQEKRKRRRKTRDSGEIFDRGNLGFKEYHIESLTAVLSFFFFFFSFYYVFPLTRNSVSRGLTVNGRSRCQTGHRFLLSSTMLEDEREYPSSSIFIFILFALEDELKRGFVTSKWNTDVPSFLYFSRDPLVFRPFAPDDSVHIFIDTVS